MTRETVFFDTPARRAMSLIVARRRPPSTPFSLPSGLEASGDEEGVFEEVTAFPAA
jgi:hypothetical protein